MSEHTEQAALFEWAAWNERRVPELALLYAIPNGGARHPAVAAKLKAEGVKAGVPDVFLPVTKPVRGVDGAWWSGLWIEMKYGRGRCSSVQEKWHKALLDQCYRVEVCYTWVDAARIIVDYLGFAPLDFGLPDAVKA